MNENSNTEWGGLLTHHPVKISEKDTGIFQSHISEFYFKVNNIKNKSGGFYPVWTNEAPWKTKNIWATVKTKQLQTKQPA